jgi:hypothetical protein
MSSDRQGNVQRLKLYPEWSEAEFQMQSLSLYRLKRDPPTGEKYPWGHPIGTVRKILLTTYSGKFRIQVSKAINLELPI